MRLPLKGICHIYSPERSSAPVLDFSQPRPFGPPQPSTARLSSYTLNRSANPSSPPSSAHELMASASTPSCARPVCRASCKLTSYHAMVSLSFYTCIMPDTVDSTCPLPFPSSPLLISNRECQPDRPVRLTTAMKWSYCVVLRLHADDDPPCIVKCAPSWSPSH